MVNEKTLIVHGSLTLSSLKTASLFTIKFTNKADLMDNIAFWNK